MDDKASITKHSHCVFEPRSKKRAFTIVPINVPLKKISNNPSGFKQNNNKIQFLIVELKKIIFLFENPVAEIFVI